MPFSSPSSHESGPSLKDQVTASFRKFIERGVTNPDGLDLADPEVMQAYELYDEWRSQEEASAKGDREKEHLANFAITTFYVDIGFNDPQYLGEVLGFLDQDLQNAEEGKDDEPLTNVSEKIKTKMKEIEGMMEK